MIKPLSEMIKPLSKHWEVESLKNEENTLSSSFRSIYSLPIKYFRMPWDNGSKLLNLQHRVTDTKNESGQIIRNLEINLSLGKKYCHFIEFPVLVEDYWSDFSVSYMNTYIDGVEDKIAQEGRARSTELIRIESDFMIAHGKHIRLPYDTDSDKYREGLMKVKRVYEQAVKLTTSIPGIKPDGLEALTLLNNKFEQEINRQLAQIKYRQSFRE